jgi:hypothetical protein
MTTLDLSSLIGRAVPSVGRGPILSKCSLQAMHACATNVLESPKNSLARHFSSRFALLDRVDEHVLLQPPCVWGVSWELPNSPKEP